MVLVLTRQQLKCLRATISLRSADASRARHSDNLALTLAEVDLGARDVVGVAGVAVVRHHLGDEAAVGAAAVLALFAVVLPNKRLLKYAQNIANGQTEFRTPPADSTVAGS